MKLTDQQKKRAADLYHGGMTNKSEVFKVLVKEFGLEVSDSTRKNVSNYIKTSKNSAIIDECERVGIDI